MNNDDVIRLNRREFGRYLIDLAQGDTAFWGLISENKALVGIFSEKAQDIGVNAAVVKIAPKIPHRDRYGVFVSGLNEQGVAELRFRMNQPEKTGPGLTQMFQEQMRRRAQEGVAA